MIVQKSLQAVGTFLLLTRERKRSNNQPTHIFTHGAQGLQRGGASATAGSANPGGTESGGVAPQRESR